MSTHPRSWWLAVVLLLAIPITGCDRVARVIPGSGIAGRSDATPALTAPGSSGGATAIPDAQLAQSIVQVQPTLPDNTGKQLVQRSGSGIVVDAEQRLILTSYAVVQPFRADGVPAYATILISTHRQLSEAPAPEYEADLVAADPANGIAVLRVVREVGGAPLGSGRFNLPAVRLGDARSAAAGLALRVFGDPGPESGKPQTLVVNRASITGVRGTPGLTNRTWLKLDARLPYGAAGGGAFNQSGALVGILAQDRYMQTAEVGQMLPLELAAPVIERAKTATTVFLAPIQMRSNIPGTTRPQPNETTWISAPVFGANAIQHASSRDLFDYGTKFPAGRPALYYEYVLQGVPNNTMIDERWFLDDIPQDSLSSSYRWDGRGFAIQGDRITAPSASGIPRGRWRLEIWAGGVLRAQSTALIGVEPKEAKAIAAGTGASATADARPQGAVTRDSTQALAFFDFTGMDGVQTLDWIVFFNNQRVYTSPQLRWDYGDAGRAWVGYTPGKALGAGKWKIELHVDGRVLAVFPIVVP